MSKSVKHLKVLERNLKGIITLNIPGIQDSSLLPFTDQDGSKASFDVHNPAARGDLCSQKIIASVPRMKRHHARTAIEQSFQAFDHKWRYTTAQHRASLLSKWSQLIKENAEDLALIMTCESGKSLAESRSEVAYGASFLDFFAGEAIRSTSTGGGFIVPTPFFHVNHDGSSSERPRGTVMAVKEPVGVAAMITPWNFPLAMITRKVGPALAAGCTTVVKPSELTPLSAIAAQTLALRAGIPEGVFQLVTAGGGEDSSEVGKEFCENPIVKKISFTGSTTVGKLLLKQSSDTVKRVSLELGGNAPFIVFADADLELAVQSAIHSKFRNAGQTCVCADRFLVEASIEEEFVHRLHDAIAHIKVGNGLTEGTTMGPLITASAVENVHRKVEEAIENGAECLEGGHPVKELGPNFYAPTLLVNVKPGKDRIWDTETFGPVVAICTFQTEHEAISIANDTLTGLASYVFTQDLSRIFRVTSRLENGIVGVNEGVISTATAPFGGVKESGMGREGSILGIEEYLETKYIFLNH